MSAFRRLSDKATAEYKEKGSKFIASALAVFTEDDVKLALEELRAEHHKARHIAYAFRLHPEERVERANDDGEPHHSAGTPILHVIQSEELYQCLVAVVRYFGGTKLGKSGLVRAYRSAAESAVELAKKEMHIPSALFHLYFGYDKLNEVQTWLDRHGIKPQDVDMQKRIRFDVCLPKDNAENLLDELCSDPRITFAIDSSEKTTAS